MTGTATGSVVFTISLGLFGCASGSQSSDGTSFDSAANTALQANPAGSVDETDPVICKRESTTNQLYPRKVCHTKSEWEEIRKAKQEEWRTRN